jgi:peptidoglycan/LPS O-acetylase OafA/YrhL
MEEHQRSSFRRDVEGLRAVAILLVVLYHVGLVPGGYVGVDVFFVISGFLITGQLTKELRSGGKLSFAGFYARRARRILPAATLCTITTVAVSAVVLSPLEARRVLTDAVTALVFGANFRFAANGSNYFSASLPPSPLQHYWSLSVEEQFYVFWPLLLVASSLVWVRRRSPDRRRRGSHASAGARSPAFGFVAVALVVVAGTSLTASILQTSSSTAWAYYSILTRAWELATGALIAMAASSMRRLDGRVAAGLTWAGLASIAVAAARFSDATPYPGYAAVLPVLGAAAVVAGGEAARRTRRGASHARTEHAAGSRGAGAELILGTSPFQRIGSWSYSWYLWHWPALILAPAMLGHALSRLGALVVAALSLVIAVASFVLVERPIRRMQGIVRRPAFGLTAGGSFIGAGLSVVLLSSLTLPSLVGGARADPLVPKAVLTRAQLDRDLRAGVETKNVPSNLTPAVTRAASDLPLIGTNGCSLQEAGVESKPCVYGDARSSTKVVMFGDSHMSAWFPALRMLSRQQHWALEVFTKSGCPPVEVNIELTWESQPYPQCSEWRHNTEMQIAALHPALVIVTWARYLEYPEARPLSGVPRTYKTIWQDGVGAIFQFLEKHASRVVFLSDSPTMLQLVPDCVAAHSNDVTSCVTPARRATLFPAVKAEEKAIAQQDGVTYIDPFSWFCAPTGCPAIVGQYILYQDNSHMVPAWSEFLEPMLADSILPVMRSH